MASTGSSTAIAADAKTRIIKHMNNDHQDSLVLYLQNYAKLGGFAARNARLVDVSLSAMTIGTGSGGVPQHVVPFTPALTSASDLRPRVVAMDQECRRALGRSEVTVREFVAPRGLALVAALIASWTFANTTYPANFLPGSFLYEHLYRHVPAWAALNYRAANYVWWTILVLHGLESLFVLMPRLRKHNVAPGSPVWLKWVGFHFFFDGFGSLLRLDKLVKDEQKKRDAKSH